MEEDEDIAEEVANTGDSHIKRKKLMLILLPLLIVIGISATIFFVLRNQNVDNGKYKIVQYNKDDQDNVTIFYDLPEFTTSVRGKEGPHELKFKLSLELANVDDLKVIEILVPKLNDVIINHTIELTTDEISGSAGLYWFKEELFYRLNLATAPIKIKNINFSEFKLAQ